MMLVIKDFIIIKQTTLEVEFPGDKKTIKGSPIAKGNNLPSQKATSLEKERIKTNFS